MGMQKLSCLRVRECLLAIDNLRANVAGLKKKKKKKKEQLFSLSRLSMVHISWKMWWNRSFCLLQEFANVVSGGGAARLGTVKRLLSTKQACD